MTREPFLLAKGFRYMAVSQSMLKGSSEAILAYLSFRADDEQTYAVVLVYPILLLRLSLEKTRGE
jgi:hypothetical protein